MSEIKIRKAVFEDVASMQKIASGNQVAVENLSQYANQGFTIWPRSAEAYKASIERSPHVLVAEWNNEVIGHLLAYTIPVVKSLNKEMGCEDDVILSLSEMYGDDTVFVDQITISRSHQREGIGQLLDDYLCKSTPHNGKWVTDIVHNPVKNIASVKFFEKLGFTEKCEIVQDEWTLGVYERSL